MPQPLDTSAIQRLVDHARLRIRAQWALEGATTASILAAAAALATIFAIRTERVTPTTGLYLLIASAGLIVAGALVSAMRRLDDEVVARRIDRASQLADRLSTAIAFDRTLGGGPSGDDSTTHDLMIAAIHDGVRAAPRADLRAATPFAKPRDLPAAVVFIVISVLAAFLDLPTTDRTAGVYGATPDFGVPGATITIDGKNLLEGVATPVAMRPVNAVMGAPNVQAARTKGFVPNDANVYLGSNEHTRPVTVLDWTATAIQIRIPDDAPIGDTQLAVFIAGKHIGSVPFKVVDRKDERYHKENTVALDPDEKAYVEAIISEIKNVAQRDKVAELDEFAKKIEQLLGQAENGEITKEQLLDALAQAEEALNKSADPNPAEVQKKMADMGKELSKDQMTKDLGQALEKNDLEKAQQELEKLAEKLDNKQLSEQQKQELAKKLDQVAKQMDQKDQKDQKQADDKQQKLEEQIRRLQKDKDQAKNDQQKQEFERRLEDKKRELEKLKKEEQQKQESEQRRAVKRLEKDLEAAAENLQKPQKDQQSEQDQEEKERQASEKLRDAERETGRVDKDQRKQAAQKKMSSQMDDLREAMRRAKQKGNKGPQDPFNRQGKNQDFIARARGQKSGQGQSWKPGQGQPGGGQGSGQQPGGPGQQPGGETWGVGHDDNLTGDPTAMSGHHKDEGLEGVHGNNGDSTRETILAAAKKGFASVGYQKVYADYQRIVEEVMRTEKLPSSYKYYVKRYFAKIHPNMAAPKAEESKTP